MTSGVVTLSLYSSRAQLLPLTLSLDCLGENKASVYPSQQTPAALPRGSSSSYLRGSPEPLGLVLTGSHSVHDLWVLLPLSRSLRTPICQAEGNTQPPESPAEPPGLTLLPRWPWRPTVGWQTGSHSSLGAERQTASQKSPNSCQVLQRPPASGRARPHAQAPKRHLCKACPLAPRSSLQGFRNKHLRRGEESGELP